MKPDQETPDDSALLQELLDRGEPIPPGNYTVGKSIRVRINAGNCGRFRDAEEYRDHLPCEKCQGPKESRR